MKSFFKRVIGAAAALALLCMSAPAAFAENGAAPYVVTVYNENNGLPTGEANTVLQTSDGYVWIGSYGGLIRYDGTAFRNYSMEGGISSSSVRSLFEDSAGRLWIGTNDAGVFVMQSDSFTHIGIPEDRSFLCIRDFCEDGGGRIYAASNSGICEISDGTVIPCIADGVAGDVVYSVAADSYGRIWGSMNSGRCAVVRDGELLDIVSSDMFFKNSEIYCTASDRDGNVVLGTSGNEIAVLEFSSESLSDGFSVRYEDTGSVSTHNRIDIAADGSLLVCGLKGFAAISPSGALTEFGERDKAMSVNAAALDYENNIWLATSSSGIIKYTEGCFEKIGGTELDGVTVNAVAALSDKSCYVGTDTGLIICGSGGERIDNELTEMFKGIRVRHIIADRNGSVWIASFSESAVVCYDPSNSAITVFNSENGLIGDRARVLLELSDGRIAVGTQSGVSFIENGSVVKNYGAEDGIDNTYILCLAEDTDGTVFAGSDGSGIYELRGDTVVNHGFDDGLGEGVVLRMLKNSDENGFFVSAGSSLYYWEDGTFRRLNNFTAAAGSIFDFYDRDGVLWFMQNNGVYSVDKAALLSGEPADTAEYGANCGLSGSLNANTWNWLTDDGQLYISTRNGISIFSFKGTENRFPKAIINSVSVDGKVYEHPSELNVESGAQRVTIDFAALSFTDTTRLRASYRLIGFDSEAAELESGKSGSVSYTNLSGGNYIFELKLYDPENPDEIETIRLKIVKAKKLTESLLFWLIVVAMLVAASCGAVLLISKVKLNRARRRQQEYQQILEQSLLCFAKAIDAKDRYTNGHSTRVAHYSRELARRIGLDEQTREHIYYMALLHDIGKIGIPDSILNKPERLTSEEEEIMRSHPLIGGEILEDFTALSDIAYGAKYHHEHFDGSGYCQGLSGTDIPKVARIISVADTYDAMSIDRCYRKALPAEVIEEELKKAAGTQLDPTVVPHMLDMIEEGVVPIDVKGIVFSDTLKK